MTMYSRELHVDCMNVETSRIHLETELQITNRNPPKRCNVRSPNVHKCS